MNWWNSFEILSKLQTTLAVLVTALGIVTLTFKIRSDHLKKAADAKRAEERKRLDEELQEKTAEARNLAVATEQKYRPRDLTADQRSAMLTVLNANEKRPATINVLSTVHGDSDRFARQIWSVLNEAGLNPQYSLCLAEYPDGVSLNPKDDTSPSTAATLAAALRAAGMDLPIFTPPKGQASDHGIDIMVGAKPSK